MEHAHHCCHSAVETATFPKPGKRMLVTGGIFLGMLALSFLEPLAPFFRPILQLHGVIGDVV